MNCRNCGKPLTINSSICPVCGIDNDSMQEETLFVELDGEDEEPKITENMAPPTLNVHDENLTSGTGELSNDTGETYDPLETYTEEEREHAKELEEQSVDIAIPSVQTPVDNVVVPKDGSAPEVVQSVETIGNTECTTNNNANLEAVGKKKKFKIAIPHGSKNVPKMLMYIVAFVFLVVGILLGKAFFSKNYCATSTPRSNKVVSSKTKFVNDGKNNVTNVGSYTYKIPESYIYDKKDKGLLIYNEEDTFRVFIRTDLGVFTDLTGAKNSVRETLKENGLIVNGLKELNTKDVELLIYETSTKSVNRMIAFADAGNNRIFYCEIVTSNNNYDYDVLAIAADIMKNATFAEVATNMENIDIFDISKVAIKAAGEYKNFISNN